MLNIPELAGCCVSNGEQIRRVVIRVVTSLLNLIIGPAGAWAALGLEGIAGYIFVHTMTRWIVAEMASRRESTSKRGYRLSPILLLSAGMMPFYWDSWESYVIVVPLLLGSFEGAFWSAFHGIRKSTKDKGERASVRRFQLFEVLSTIIAALSVIALKYMEVAEYGGAMGSALALVAFLIPMNESAKNASIGLSTSDVWSERATLGRIPTSSLGTISFLSIWSMRVISLEAGGIALLGGMVAASRVVGFTISEINQSRQTAEDADIRNWKVGNYFALCGILLMMASLVYSQHTYFLLAYLLCTCGTSGLLYPLEVLKAGQLLSGDGGNIGLRERIKFAVQAKIMLLYFTSLAPVILYLGEVPQLDQVLLPGIILASMCCILNLRITEELMTTRQSA